MSAALEAVLRQHLQGADEPVGRSATAAAAEEELLRVKALGLNSSSATGGGPAPAGGVGARGLASGLRPLPLPKVAHARGSLPGADIPSMQQPDQATKGQRSSSVVLQAGSAAVQHQQDTRAGGAAAGNTVRQLVLAKDLLRAAQGLQGSYTAFAGGAGAAADPAVPGAGLVLAPSDALSLPEGHRTLMHELGELGLMLKRVQAAIAEGQRPGCGSVRQALCGALHEEVTDYLRLMAVLEGQLAVPQPVPGAWDAAGPEGGAAPAYLTLRRLALWLAEPLRRMRLLAALVDGSAACSGGDLAGRVWAAGKVGDPLARSYATRILHQMCVPLFDMIRRWVFEGVLEDPACEFFVVAHTSAAGAAGDAAAAAPPAAAAAGGGGRDLWRHAYRLEPAKLPPFVAPELAATILRAGKSINFLRDACGDAAWVRDWAPAAARDAAALGYGELSVLERVVVSASRSVDARLMAVLRSTGEWDRHCQAIRRYLLLGQGDFAVALLDAMDAELCKPASAASSPASLAATLNHQLRTALLSCAGAGRLEEEPGGAHERLGAEVAAHPGGGETGWDVFSLSYRLGPPLSSVFTPEAQRTYARLGRLLWRLRRTERSLNEAWHMLKVEVERRSKQLRRDACVGELTELVRSCLRLHADMAHISTNLAYYYNLEVVECAWSDFMAAAAAAPDLDCLIAAHDRFLATVLDRALLGAANGGDGGAAAAAGRLRATLVALLDNCMGLRPLVARLREQVSDAVAQAELEKEARRANTAAGQWGSSGAGGARRGGLSVQALQDVSSSLVAVKAEHDRLREAFRADLPKAASEVNAEVRFLQARLEFSGFYKSAAGAAAAAP